MFCPNCGNNCGDAKFCPECGCNLRKVSIEKGPEHSEPMETRYPDPPLGRYNNHDHDYVEINVDSITIYRKPFLMRETSRTIMFSQIKAISITEARKLKSGGFLSVQDRSAGAALKTSLDEAINDECSIAFSWKQNDSFLAVYEFLKAYGEKALKNHQLEKWSSHPQQIGDIAQQTIESEIVANYAPEQEAKSSADTFDIDELGWHPGKKKQERKIRVAELEKSGQVYCPKCLSTSISADKKGFGVGKAVVGAAAFGGIGLIAGNIGAKKVICTCLKCGYQWQAGKK